ncbi:hypothetical protein ACFQS7_08330 [Dankookia sp. GCM10030260]|uniref:hypothetical protein n=1 Tax=Dankookia sp. GCM10030260 TaxID=3273390 RepID=UPI003623BC09
MADEKDQSRRQTTALIERGIALRLVLGLLLGVFAILKPWLIGYGVHLPMALIVLGVFGRVLSFGFLGLFIGPALIAVAMTLLQAWRAVAVAPDAAAPPA